MAAGGKREENGDSNYIKFLRSNTSGILATEQLHELENEGKLCISGKQYINPQGLKVLRTCLETSLLATDGSSRVYPALQSHENVAVRTDLERDGGQRINFDEAAIFPSLQPMSYNESETDDLEAHKRKQKCTKAISPEKIVAVNPRTTSECPIDKIPVARDDSGLADMDSSSPRQAIPDVSTSLPTAGCQENNRVAENVGGPGNIKINVVINAPIHGTLNINGFKS